MKTFKQFLIEQDGHGQSPVVQLVNSIKNALVNSDGLEDDERQEYLTQASKRLHGLSHNEEIAPAASARMRKLAERLAPHDGKLLRSEQIVKALDEILLHAQEN